MSDAPRFLWTTLQSRDGRSTGPVCRLGLASRGNTGLTSADVHLAVERGVNFLNWCGTVGNGMSRAVAELGARRRDVVVCAQFEARTAADAAAELRGMLETLRTDYIDVLTFYYVEEPAEWQEVIGPDGALAYCASARDEGRVRLLGLTTHQRPLAADMARSGLLDLLMIRYNAAHRGAETEIFPTTDALRMPIVAYTALRWGALLQPTPDDPPGFVVPGAAAWYRFVLQSSSVAVVLAAPDGRAELEEDLAVLDTTGPLSPEEYERLAAHGRRVRQHAGSFP
jgi:predicted aldo/keto reductase-like oxidoreductase